MMRARATFAKPNIWKKLQVAGMRQNFSWDRSAREYVKLYENALAGPRAYIGAILR
jgi:starch synthase